MDEEAMLVLEKTIKAKSCIIEDMKVTKLELGSQVELLRADLMAQRQRADNAATGFAQTHVADCKAVAAAAELAKSADRLQQLRQVEWAPVDDDGCSEVGAANYAMGSDGELDALSTDLLRNLLQAAGLPSGGRRAALVKRYRKRLRQQ